MRSYNASDLFCQVEENRVLGARGDFILGYKIEYPEKYSQSEDDFETMQTTWVRALRNVPVGTIVAKSDVYTKKEFDPKALPNDTFLQKKTREYFNGRNYVEHHGYVFFIYTRINTLKNESIKNPFIFPDLATFDKEDIGIQAFINEVEQAVEMIGKSNLLKLLPLNEQEILNYRDFYFNGFQSDYLTDLDVYKDHIEADDKKIGVFALCNERNFPDTVVPAIEDADFSCREKGFVFFEGFLDCLGLTLGCPHVYNQIIYIDDHRHHVNQIYKHRTDMYGARRLSPENMTGYQRLDKCLEEVGNDSNSHYVRGHNNIVFWADTAEEFAYYKKNISSLLKFHEFKPVYPTQERLKAIFYNTFFANASCLDNANTYLVDLRIAACLFVTNTNYKNDSEGVIFNDRIFNVPVFHDIWDANRKRKTSRNFAIIAPTGRGKSFTWEHISRQLIEDNVTNVVIDLGDSHIKMAKLFPKDQVAIFKYKEGEPLGLNPFALLPGEVPSSMKVEELCQFVWSLIKKQNQPSENEKTSLRKIINHYYITEDEFFWDTFYYFIKNNRDHIRDITGIESAEFFNVEEFLHAGGDYIEEGNYANLFRRTEDVSQNFIGKKLIIFELDEIKDNSVLLSIMMQVISEAIHKTIWKDRSSRGVIFYDEFAKQLKFPEVLSRVAYQIQAIRKQNGAVGIVLQSLNQLPETPDGKSILDNIETFIFLQGSNYTPSIERLGLSTHDVSQLNSLASKFDGDQRYSEVYIKANRYGNVFRIEVPKEVFLAYQTEGEVHEALMSLYDQTGSMEQAITQYMSNH